MGSGQSVRSVAAELQIPLSTAYYHARSVCLKHPVLNLKALQEKELGYLLGVYVGDGSLIRHKARGEYMLKIAFDRSKDADIIEFVAAMFRKAGKQVTRTNWRSVTFLRIWSKPLYDFIQTYVLSLPTITSNRHMKILLSTEKWNIEFAIGFLGGLIDSDGHVMRTKSGGHFGAGVTTSSTSLRDQLQNLCSSLGLTTTTRIDKRGTPNVRPRYMIYITSDSMRKICSEIPSIKHQRLHGGPGRT